LAALKGEETLAELPQQFDAHANPITQWRSQLLEGAADELPSFLHKSIRASCFGQ
jgi:transposase-like protein